MHVGKLVFAQLMDHRPAGHDFAKHVESIEFVQKLTGHY